MPPGEALRSPGSVGKGSRARARRTLIGPDVADAASFSILSTCLKHKVDRLRAGERADAVLTAAAMAAVVARHKPIWLMASELPVTSRWRCASSFARLMAVASAPQPVRMTGMAAVSTTASPSRRRRAGDHLKRRCRIQFSEHSPSASKQQRTRMVVSSRSASRLREGGRNVSAVGPVLAEALRSQVDKRTIARRRRPDRRGGGAECDAPMHRTPSRVC